MRTGPGRPRTAGLDERVVDAALELIDAGEPVTVAALVERSGVSRAAIYRRWPAVTDLIADALDRGREVVQIPLDGDLRANFFDALLGAAAHTVRRYPDERFRQRLRLALADRTLQHAYWRAHVSRRRVPMERLLRTGIERGVLRDDLDVDACIDLIVGIFYYQSVVRGTVGGDRDALERCRQGLEIAWRGMSA